MSEKLQKESDKIKGEAEESAENGYKTQSKNLIVLLGAVQRIDNVFNKLNEHKFPLQTNIINRGLYKRLSQGMPEGGSDDLEIRYFQNRCWIKTKQHRLEYHFSGKVILDGKQVCERRGDEWLQIVDGDVYLAEGPAICASLLARAASVLESFISRKSEILGDPTRNPAVKSLLELNDLKREIADIPFNLVYSQGFYESNRKLEDKLSDYRDHLLELKKANVKLGGAFYRSLVVPVEKVEKKMEEQKHPRENQSKVRKMIAEVMDVYSESMTLTYYQFRDQKNRIQGLLTQIKELLENLKDENLATNVSDPYLEQVLEISDPQFEVPKVKQAYR